MGNKKTQSNKLLNEINNKHNQSIDLLKQLQIEVQQLNNLLTSREKRSTSKKKSKHNNSKTRKVSTQSPMSGASVVAEEVAPLPLKQKQVSSNGIVIASVMKEPSVPLIHAQIVCHEAKTAPVKNQQQQQQQQRRQHQSAI